MKKLIVIAVAAMLAAPLSAQTQSPDHAKHHLAQATAAKPLVDGEVRKVDKEAGRLTLKHGPIPNLDMPDMTMVFRVKEPAMLDKLKVGDKVKFAADKVNGVITVTSIEVLK
jgi:Cu(I)/Ag(I) efflux system periplasmic protein CusF